MHWDVVRFKELTSAERARWAQLQQAAPSLASPFLHPGYTQCLTQVRSDISVAVLRNGSAAAAFFPFEVERSRIGRPAGYPLTCCQAVVADEAAALNPTELLQQCGLRALRFDHLIDAGCHFGPYQEVRMPSPYVDLRDGFEAYRAAKRASGSKLFDEMARLQRKLAREHGTVTVEPTHDESCLEHLIAWKEQHCRHTQAANIFPFHWPAAMLRAVLRHQTGDDFGGIMWRLSAGGRPIAANVVLRTRATAYGWFMSFDPAFRRYSPGMLLLLRVLEECSRAGIRRFDLGKGTSGFKRRVMNAAAEVAEGSIDSRLMLGAIWRNWLQLRERVRKSPLRTSARRVDRILTRFRWLIGSSH